MRINQQSTIQQNKRNRRLAFIGLIAVQVISAVLDIVFYERKQYHLFFTVAEGFFFLWLLLIWLRLIAKLGDILLNGKMVGGLFYLRQLGCYYISGSHVREVNSLRI